MTECSSQERIQGQWQTHKGKMASSSHRSSSSSALSREFQTTPLSGAWRKKPGCTLPPCKDGEEVALGWIKTEHNGPGSADPCPHPRAHFEPSLWAARDPTGASPSKGTWGETYVLAPPPIPAIRKLHPRLLAEEEMPSWGQRVGDQAGTDCTVAGLLDETDHDDQHVASACPPGTSVPGTEVGSQILSLNHSFWLFLSSSFSVKSQLKTPLPPPPSTLEMQTILGGAFPPHYPLFIRIMPTHPHLFLHPP